MNTTLPKMHQRVVVNREHFQDFFLALTSKGYQVVGPTVREHAIVYDTLSSVTDLPIGYTDEQDGGMYRLKNYSTRQYLVIPSGRIPGKNSSFPL